jgi:RHS repeat-associated protein
MARTVVQGAITSTYAFGVYEQEGAITRNYYSFGGQMIAVRDSNLGLSYLYGDHLGSVSASTNATGQLLNIQHFDAWGKKLSGSMSQTDRNFTGQYLDDTGLLFYNARYYDPGVGRFVSADTVVPSNASGSMDGIALKPLTVSFHEYGFNAKLNSENQFAPWFMLSDKERRQLGNPMGPSNPQALNRYSYVQNNPLKYTDPSGHAVPPIRCPQCNALWGNISTWNAPAKGAVVVGCFIVGCNVNYSTGDVTAPTLEQMVSSTAAPAMTGGGRVLQSGGHTLKNSTASALNKVHGLNLHSREWGRALEELKAQNFLPNNHHGKITEAGDYIDIKTGEVLGNLLEYLP